VNLDVSVAPEIAQLTEPRPAPDGPAPTVGRLAAQLRLITASPERWWGLVRFDPDQPVRVAIPTGPWPEVWLMISPPYRPTRRAGDGAGWASGAECACEAVTVVAGEVTEVTEVIEVIEAAEVPGACGVPGVCGNAEVAEVAAPLLPGRVRVHAPGHSHRVVNLGRTYAVTMHAHVR
jgi:hypothetical protein